MNSRRESEEERLSALMDGEEIADGEPVSGVAEDAELHRRWKNYHLIRDILRGDVGKGRYLDITTQVADAIKANPLPDLSLGQSETGGLGKSCCKKIETSPNLIKSVIHEDPGDKMNLTVPTMMNAESNQALSAGSSSEPENMNGERACCRKKSLILFPQIVIAACVCFAIILGVQHYEHTKNHDTTAAPDLPVFKTLPMVGKVSPVGFGVVPEDDVQEEAKEEEKTREEHHRANAMRQDHEFQRRLAAEQMDVEKNGRQDKKSMETSKERSRDIQSHP